MAHRVLYSATHASAIPDDEFPQGLITLDDNGTRRHAPLQCLSFWAIAGSYVAAPGRLAKNVHGNLSCRSCSLRARLGTAFQLQIHRWNVKKKHRKRKEWEGFASYATSPSYQRSCWRFLSSTRLQLWRSIGRGLQPVPRRKGFLVRSWASIVADVCRPIVCLGGSACRNHCEVRENELPFACLDACRLKPRL